LRSAWRAPDDRCVRAISFVVTGRVQGVGFRAGAAAEARRLQLGGFVQNRRDGAVEGRAQGDDAQLATFVAWLRRGPTFASVAALDVQDVPLDERAGDFEVRR